MTDAAGRTTRGRENMEMDELRVELVRVLKENIPEMDPLDLGVIVCELREPVLRFLFPDEAKTGWPGTA